MDLIIKNKIIEAPITRILNRLKEDVGDNYLDFIGPEQDSGVRITCPYHSGGHEKTPDCYIYNKKDNPKIYYGTVHCLGGDTEIITRYGIKKIGDLVNKEVEIINGNGEWEKVKIESYGVMPTKKITLAFSGNKSGIVTKDIYSTLEHRWFVRGRNTYTYTKDLKYNDHLECIPTKAKPFKIIEDGVRHGFIFGDGFKSYNEKTNHLATVFFYTKEKERVSKYFDDVQEMRHPSGKIFLGCKYKGNRDLTKIPTFEDSYDYIMSFLAGYFAADGSFSVGRSSISCKDFDTISAVRDLCVYCGLMCKRIHSRYREGFGKWSWIYDFKILNMSLPDNFDISNRIPDKKSNMNYCHWKVVEVSDEIYNIEVFCTQTSTHSFALADNILTGNCFSCGAKRPLYNLIGYCLGKDDEFGKEWLVTNFGETIADKKLFIEPLELKDSKKNKSPIEYLDESILTKYDYIHNYILNRKISEEVCIRFRVGYDIENDMITFPIWDYSGGLVGINKRSVKGKFYDLAKGINKAVYLLNFIREDYYNGIDYPFIVVCES